MRGPLAASYDPFEGITNNQGIIIGNMDRLAQVEAQGQAENGLVGDEQNNAHGLLEDVVPFQVRRPCSSTTSSSYELYSPDVSSPSDSILSWPPHDYSTDMSVLSNLM